MIRLLPVTVLLIAVTAFTASAESIMIADYSVSQSQLMFPDLAENDALESAETTQYKKALELEQAIWPFEKKEADIATMKPKSSRKAFFLSLLMPGLGELYVGSKRGLAFMAVEAFSWWMYSTNNSKGNDLEDEYEKFADMHWQYYNENDLNGGDPGRYNYWGYVQSKYKLNEGLNPGDEGYIGPEDYDLINDETESQTSSGSSHFLPSTKTQQYYEMIGKYDQFVYGWDDIRDPANGNTSLIDENGDITYKYDEDTAIINSPLRLEYMDMRGKSNDKLSAAQSAVSIMLINRVLSAIDAGRLAYKHNLKLESDLSMIRVRVVQKHIIDNQVPMLMVSKRF